MKNSQMMDALVKVTGERVRVAIAILRAWQMGCHEGWRDPVCGASFDALVDRGLMEVDANGATTRRRLTSRGMVVLIKILDTLTIELTKGTV